MLHKERWLTILFSGLFLLCAGMAAFTGQYALAIIPFALLFFYAGWQHKRFLFFLLLFAIPFSFEYNFSSGLGTDIPDELLMLLVSVIFFAWLVYSPGVVPKNTCNHPLLVLLVILMGWTLVTAAFSTSQQVSFKYILAKSWYLGAFILAPLILFREKNNLVVAAKTLAAAMLLATMIILFRHAGRGFSFASINAAASPFFRNHVNYSSLLVCILPILTGAFILSGKKKTKTWLGLAIGALLIALFFTYARGAWVALLTGIAAYWLIRKRMLVYSYIVFLLVMIGLVFWLQSNDRYLQYAGDYKTTIFHADFGKHLVSTYKLKDLSTAERFYRWVAGVRMIKDNWLTGYGPNSFYENYKDYTIPAYKTWVSDNPEHSTVHNYFLLTAIEQGIPGLVFLLVLLGAMLYYAQHIYKRSADKFYKTVAASTGVMIAMIIALNFFSDLIETDKIGSLFFLCIAVLVTADINSKQGSDLSSDIQRIS